MTTVTLIEVSEERYTEMLEVLPPACWLGGDFLVGEPTDHRECEISNLLAPTFAAFFSHNSKYFEAERCLTRREFKYVRDNRFSCPHSLAQVTA